MNVQSSKNNVIESYEFIKSYRKESCLDDNLCLSFPWFFFFYACWFKNQHCDGKGGIGYTNHDINDEDYQHLFDEEGFVCKSFEIKKNDKHYLFRISVKAHGQFEIFHNDEFIRNLVVLSSWTYPDDFAAVFNKTNASIHFVYISDDFCLSEEVVVLSMQFSDLK